MGLLKPFEVGDLVHCLKKNNPTSAGFEIWPHDICEIVAIWTDNEHHVDIQSKRTGQNQTVTEDTLRHHNPRNRRGISGDFFGPAMVPISPVSRDETQFFRIVPVDCSTVREFLDLVTQEFWGEYGTITFHSMGMPLDHLMLFYKYGEFIGQLPPSDMIPYNRRIMKLQGYGGWSQMDYQIII